MGLKDVAKVGAAVSRQWLGLNVSYGWAFYAWVGRLRFHLFLREEKGVAYHDHPWPFTTFPLRAYVEEVYDPKTNELARRVVPAFRLSHRPATLVHRILGPVYGPGWVPTIVWRGRHERDWCYWRLDGKRPHSFPWRKYLDMMESKPEANIGH